MYTFWHTVYDTKHYCLVCNFYNTFLILSRPLQVIFVISRICNSRVQYITENKTFQFVRHTNWMYEIDEFLVAMQQCPERKNDCSVNWTKSDCSSFLLTPSWNIITCYSIHQQESIYPATYSRKTLNQRQSYHHKL